MVEQALANRPKGGTILLSHTPWQTEEAAGHGVELMLCGHTHGGQIWPLGYLVETRYPLMGGRYDVDSMAVIVCRGTGTGAPNAALEARRDTEDHAEGQTRIGPGLAVRSGPR